MKLNLWRAKSRGAAVKTAVVVAVLASVIAAGVVGASVGIKQAVEDGSRAQSIEAALGANDVAVKAVVQALLIAEEREFGLADDKLVSAAIAEARNTLGELEADVALFDSNAQLAVIASHVTASGESVLAAAERGEVIAAADALRIEAVPKFERLRDALTLARNDVVEGLELQGSIAGLAGVIAAFLVVLVMPTAFVLAYRSLLRRQIRHAQVELDARLAAEREITRSRDEFIANISHELRTPLTSIYGFSEVLLEGGVDDEESRDLVAMINRETSELGRMVEDLLVTAGSAESEISFATETTSVAGEMAQVIEPLAWHGVDIVTDVEDAGIVVDRLRFRQVVRNLVSNGLKHGSPPVWVVGWASPEDRVYTVVVSDHGDGIPDEMLGNVFHRFVHKGSAPLTAGSVGLGLAVAKALATGLGGNLEYGRVQNRTEFVFTVPLAQSPTGSLVG